MKGFEWDIEKNQRLREERGVSFEDVVVYLSSGKILDIVPHSKQERYPGQRMFIIEIDGYAYLVPFMETEEVVLLKTIIPSRKATNKYLERR